MTNLTISENEILTISEDTIVDNVISQGGRIVVPPKYSFKMNGEFIFEATSSGDPENFILNAISNRFSIETGRDGTFEGFAIYPSFPVNKSLFFPCLTFDSFQTEEIGASFFGGEYFNLATIDINLAFKKNQTIVNSTETLSEEALADYYLFKSNELLNDIGYMGNMIKVGEVKIDSTLRVPEEKNQTLYGFSMDVKIEYTTE